MSSVDSERLYQLLPAVYRLRDAEQGYPLRALIEVLAGQAQVVEADIARLYENWFIETCDEWVVPYLADLLGVRGLLPPERAGWSQRALVANTLQYRQRKGTVPLLERLVHDVTGWAARVVELYKNVSVTQYLDHLRPKLGGTADLRELRDSALIGSAFDPLAYTPDVRLMSGTRQAPQVEAERPASRPGRSLVGVGQARPNLPNIGLYIWRLKPYRIERATAYSHGDGRYSFSPLGNDIPLFNHPDERTDFSNVALEHQLPVRLRTEPLAEELKSRAQNGEPSPGFFSPKPAFEIFAPTYRDIEMEAYSIWLAEGRPRGRALDEWLRAEQRVLEKGPGPLPLSADQISVESISDADWSDPRNLSRRTKLVVDPEMGRIFFPGVPKDKIDKLKILVSYNYGFSDDIGGGPYDRRPISDPADPKANVVQLEDNATHSIENTQIELKGSQWTIQAANGRRPVLLGDLVLFGGAETAELTLSGLLIAGQIQICGPLGKLRIIDCTLVPGIRLTPSGAFLPKTPSITTGEAGTPFREPGTSLQVKIERSIVGPIFLPDTIESLSISDSIIDAPEPGTEEPAPSGLGPMPSATEALFVKQRPPRLAGAVVVEPIVQKGQLCAIAGNARGALGPTTSLQRVTVFGDVRVRQLVLGENVLFTAPLTVGDDRLLAPPKIDETRISLARHCYIPAGSKLPARNREECVDEAKGLPVFTARRHGEPGYAQLSLSCPAAIRAGGTNGGEIGVFHNLHQPQREGALLAQLEEYLRFGLEAGLIYVT